MIQRGVRLAMVRDYCGPLPVRLHRTGTVARDYFSGMGGYVNVRPDPTPELPNPALTQWRIAHCVTMGD